MKSAHTAFRDRSPPVKYSLVAHEQHVPGCESNFDRHLLAAAEMRRRKSSSAGSVLGSQNETPVDEGTITCPRISPPGNAVEWKLT